MSRKVKNKMNKCEEKFFFGCIYLHAYVQVLYYRVYSVT